MDELKKGVGFYKGIIIVLIVGLFAFSFQTFYNYKIISEQNKLIIAMQETGQERTSQHDDLYMMYCTLYNDYKEIMESRDYYKDNYWSTVEWHTSIERDLAQKLIYERNGISTQ